jgi:hypothetical protein
MLERTSDHVAGFPGFIKVKCPKRRYRPRHEQFRDGYRVAVERAFMGAKVYRAGMVPTLAAAARSCGSNVEYVRAALVILKANDPALESRVRCGVVPLLEAAHQISPVVKMVSIFGAVDAKTRIAFFRKYGNTESVLNDLAVAEAESRVAALV